MLGGGEGGGHITTRLLSKWVRSRVSSAKDLGQASLQHLQFLPSSPCTHTGTSFFRPHIMVSRRPANESKEASGNPLLLMASPCCQGSSSWPIAGQVGGQAPKGVSLVLRDEGLESPSGILRLAPELGYHDCSLALSEVDFLERRQRRPLPETQRCHWGAGSVFEFPHSPPGRL